MFYFRSRVGLRKLFNNENFPIFTVCLVFVICVHRRVVEGSGVGSAAWACVVHVEKSCQGGCNFGYSSGSLLHGLE